MGLGVIDSFTDRRRLIDAHNQMASINDPEGVKRFDATAQELEAVTSHDFVASKETVLPEEPSGFAAMFRSIHDWLANLS